MDLTETEQAAQLRHALWTTGFHPKEVLDWMNLHAFTHDQKIALISAGYSSAEAQHFTHYTPEQLATLIALTDETLQ